MEINKIYNESNIETMKRMPDGFVDLVVTSPPYDDMRDYNGFSFPFEDIAKELYRVIKDGGVVVWIVGDATIDGSESGTSFRQALFFKEIGFKLHDTMIYEKAGMSMPSSNRYHQVMEYMFVFSKGKPKTFNPLKDRKNRWTSSFGNSSTRQKNGELEKKGKIEFDEYGMRFNIWRYANGAGFGQKDEAAYGHPATFPEQLCGDHINSWSNEGDLVYDCFMGSGTTAKISHVLNRNWIGSEISETYVELANKRLAPYLAQTSLF
jgi:DNA modification methylase